MTSVKETHAWARNYGIRHFVVRRQVHFATGKTDRLLLLCTQRDG